MKKIISALILCIVIASTAWADPIPKPVDFPTLGICTGNNVRLRESPSTKSKILGQLNDRDYVVVLDETLAGGETWYEVDHPAKKGKAYVFGKYIEAFYDEEKQSDPLLKLIMNLYLTYGVTPEKAVLLSGRPKKRDREIIGADKLERINMNWGDYNVEYLGGHLTSVEVNRGRKPFGNIRIGDDTEKLIDSFGNPRESDGSSYTYQEGEMTYITFLIKNDKVTGMNYQVYYDIEE